MHARNQLHRTSQQGEKKNLKLISLAQSSGEERWINIEIGLAEKKKKHGKRKTSSGIGTSACSASANRLVGRQ
jgi:tmRNA-binding protein